MSNNTETFVISLKDRNFLKGLTAAGKKTDKTKVKVQGLTGAVGHLRGALAGVSIAFLGREVIRTLADFERFEAVLTNTLGSNSAAKKAMDEITQFAARTPFAVDKLTDSYVKLANQGFVPTKNEMRKLGDLAASTGKDFDQLTEALIDGQVGEFERLKEFGIRANKSGDQVKFTFKGVATTVAFTEKAMQSYILSLGDVKGVSGAMAAISKTTGGQISNLGDAVTQLMLKLGTGLKPAISGTINILSTVVSSLGNFLDWLDKGGTGVDILVSALIGLGSTLLLYNGYLQATALWTGIVTKAQWLWNAAMTANPIGLIVVGIGLLIAAIVLVSRKFTGFGKAWQHVLQGSKLLFFAFVSGIKAYFNTFLQGFVIGLNVIQRAWYEFRNTMSLGNEKENNAFIAKIDKDTERRKKAIVDSIKETTDLTGAALTEFKLAALSIQKRKELADKKETEDAVNGKKLPASTVKGAKKKGLGAGISEIKASAPKTFNINIGALIKEQNISTTNLRETSLKIKEAVTEVLLSAVNDAQIIAE